ncbi:hypothetical protein PMAYCL1PPCAC_15894, partial [Pristionchus mayeri]
FQMLDVDWALLLYALYVPLLLFLYLLEIIVMFLHRRRAFKSSFYSIFSVIAVAIVFQFWRVLLLPLLFFCLLISVAPVWFLFCSPIEFLDMDGWGTDFTWFYLTGNAEPQGAIWFNMVLLTALCNGISLLIYGACLIRLCFYSMNRDSKVERNLFVVGFSTMLFSLPYMAAMLPWLTDLK